MDNPVFSAADMDFQFVTNFTLAWTTASDYYGSAPGSFWEAVTPDASWKSFGSLSVAQTNNPSGTYVMLVARNSAGTSQSLPPLAPPSGFTKVWDDHGTGNNGADGACWQINAPSGYVALGSVFNNANYNAPNPDDYVCIREDLVTQIGTAINIWNDSGTGSVSGNLQCYSVVPQYAPPSDASPGTQVVAGAWALNSGSFLTSNQYGFAGNQLSVLTLPKAGEAHPGPGDSAPSLGPNVNVAPASAFALAATLPVLFPMITDPGKNLEWKIANPQYTVEIWGRWSNIVSMTTTADSGSIQQTITSGFEQNASTSWSDEVGASVTVNAQASVGIEGLSQFKLGVSVGASYSHVWSGSSGTITSSSTAISVNGNVPAKSFAVLWQLNYSTYLRRQDGSYVGKIEQAGQQDGYTLNIGTSSYEIAISAHS